MFYVFVTCWLISFMNAPNHHLDRSSNEAIFTRIYAHGHWGRSPDPHDRFFSGSGSRDPAVVEPYIESVEAFVRSLPFKPSGLDLGCGDFFVGSCIRHLFDHYTACDVVGPMIDHHRARFQHFDVDFRKLDISRDPLPQADVGMVRQVLQHLSNDCIARFVTAIPHSCRYLICTEHLPAVEGFPSNIDKPTGGYIRLEAGSGVDLMQPPFNLQAVAQRQLCVVPEHDGVIVTTLYQFH
jgi:hypothetical protein